MAKWRLSFDLAAGDIDFGLAILVGLTQADTSISTGSVPPSSDGHTVPVIRLPSPEDELISFAPDAPNVAADRCGEA